MANETQFRATTRIIATRGVKEYRETIPAVVGPDDHVLEVGCEWGTTTAVLAQYAAHVIGTDISPKCVGRARAMRPGLDFRVLDAFASDPCLISACRSARCTWIYRACLGTAACST